MPDCGKGYSDWEESGNSGKRFFDWEESGNN